ncbi:MAG TPA: DUF2784 domain-containing protein [Methylotenera sp.]|nr:DUF2784 domain-containing protein [Methylotenera sp.]
MYFRLAADSVLLLHLAFILFALLGGAMTVWWRWIPFVHLPAAAWGFFVELASRICPLTYLENYFRIKAGQSGYTDSFVEHYLLDIIYPSGLTPDTQFALAGVVVIVNIAIYGWLFFRRRAGYAKVHAKDD